jgi:hypothetical protein
MKRLTVRELETTHRSLDLEIHRLERRGAHMTPLEQTRATELKKRRLVTKDMLFDARRASS